MAEQDLHTLFLETDGEFYATPELNQRLNLILYLLENSEQLLFVLAEAGHGKTTLLNQVISKAKDNWKIFTPAGTPDLTKTRLLASLLSAFNVRHEGKPEHVLYETLRSHVAATHHNEQLPILIVDDAHMLPLDTLSLIVDLVMRGESRTRLRVLLFCEPQINSILAAPEFEIVRNTLTNTLDIPPFSESQVQGYIQRRLRKSPFVPEDLFGDRAIRDIYQESEGIPAVVNELTEQLIEDSVMAADDFEGAQEHEDDTAPQKTLLWVAGIVLILGLLIFGMYQVKDYLGDALEVEDEVPTDVLIPIGEDPIESPNVDEEAPPPIAEEPVIDDASLPGGYDEHPDMPGVKTAYWLKKQARSSYTIQLYADENSERVREFAQRQKERLDTSSHPLANYVTTYPGDDSIEWNVVTFGIFETSVAADRVRATLPASIISYGARVTRLSAVYEQIKDSE